VRIRTCCFQSSLYQSLFLYVVCGRKTLSNVIKLSARYELFFYHPFSNCLRAENFLTAEESLCENFFQIPFVLIVKRCREEKFLFVVVMPSVTNSIFVAGGKVGSFACLGCAVAFEGRINMPMFVLPTLSARHDA
jgi:hypothetical protein